MRDTGTGEPMATDLHMRIGGVTKTGGRVERFRLWHKADQLDDAERGQLLTLS